MRMSEHFRCAFTPHICVYCLRRRDASLLLLLWKGFTFLLGMILSLLPLDLLADDDVSPEQLPRNMRGRLTALALLAVVRPTHASTVWSLLYYKISLQCNILFILNEVSFFSFCFSWSAQWSVSRKKLLCLIDFPPSIWEKQMSNWDVVDDECWYFLLPARSLRCLAPSAMLW